MDKAQSNKKHFIRVISFLLILTLIAAPATISATAKSKRATYKVKFNSNGGKVSKKTKKVVYKKRIGTLPKATKTGHTFKGWYTSKTGGSKVSSKTKYKKRGNRTLYAKWKVKSADIYFDANGGEASFDSKTLKYSEKYDELPVATREGLEFLGWSTKKNGGDIIDSETKMKYTGDKTLYARWDGISSLIFSYRNGKKAEADKEIMVGDTYGELPKTSRKYYKFKGWYTKKYNGKQVDENTLVETDGNITIYAQWDWKMSKKKMYVKKKTKARSGKKRSGFAGVTIHNTGNSSKTGTALSHAKYLKGKGRYRRASWHYCVDDKIATKSIPENEIAWHAGDGKGKGNRKTISIEICMNKGGDLFDATENGAKLAADILHRRGITKAKSGVNIFQHNYFSSYRKNCPEKIRAGNPYGWTTFVKRVNYYLDNM